MINFKNIVVNHLLKEELLIETGAPPTQGFALLEAIYKGEQVDNKANDAKTAFDELKRKLNEYGMNLTGTNPNLRTMCAQLTNMSKNNAGFFVNAGLHEYYPLADFLCLVGNTSTSGSNFPVGIKSEDASLTHDRITTSANNVLKIVNEKVGPGGNLLFDYEPISLQISKDHIAIKKKVTNLNGVGNILLENFKDKSILQTLYFILELRRKSRILKVCPEKNVSKPSVDVNGYLYNIYQRGMEKSNPNLQAYSRIDTETLFTISKQVFDLFFSEAARHLDSSTKESFNEKYMKKLGAGMSSIKGPDPLYKSFIENTPLESGEFVWKSQPGSDPTETTDVPAKTIPGEKLVGGYTLGNIMKLNTEESKELITTLRDLVKYIEEGETMIGAITASLKTLSNALDSVSLTVGSGYH